MKLVHGFGVGALALGLAAPFAGNPPHHRQGTLDIDAITRAIDEGSDHVSALQLAAWIRDRKSGLRVIDVRSARDFSDGAIPTAQNIPIDQLAKTSFGPEEIIVLYSQEGAHAGQAWVVLRALGVANAVFVPGGYTDWQDDVMQPALATDLAPAERARIVALSHYFGGMPRITDPMQAVGPQRSSRRRGC